MSAATTHDKPVILDEQGPAATPRERRIGDSSAEAHPGTLSLILCAVGLLLISLSIGGPPIDVHPQFLSSLAIIIFALALRAAEGPAARPKRD